MENATKALLIAGGVLIAILILSIGVILYIDFGSQAKVYQNTWSATQLQRFNSTFEEYIGKTDITAQDILTLYNQVQEYEKQGIKVNFSVVGTNDKFKDNNTKIEFLQENYNRNFSIDYIKYDEATFAVNAIKFK